MARRAPSEMVLRVVWSQSRPDIAGRARQDTAHAAPDEALLIAAAQADPRAFAPLYDRYLDPVFRYCFRRLGDREAAEDATSQVFCKALAALPAYRDGAFAGWLFTIAHNVVTDHYRRQRRDQPFDDAEEPVDGELTPEERAVAADEGRRLRALLARLPDDQRRVVELRLAGLSGAEIAHALDRSPGAVKMLQFRAITRLRALLNGPQDPPEPPEKDQHGAR